METYNYSGFDATPLALKLGTCIARLRIALAMEEMSAKLQLELEAVEATLRAMFSTLQDLELASLDAEETAPVCVSTGQHSPERQSVRCR